MCSCFSKEITLGGLDGKSSSSLHDSPECKQGPSYLPSLLLGSSAEDTAFPFMLSPACGVVLQVELSHFLVGKAKP